MSFIYVIAMSRASSIMLNRSQQQSKQPHLVSDLWKKAFSCNDFYFTLKRMAINLLQRLISIQFKFFFFLCLPTQICADQKSHLCSVEDKQCFTKMGFGSDLKNSHEAVLKLQDWELRLLETVKKFMALRIKSDKEYASTLQNLCNQVDKESTVQMNYVSNVSKVRIISSFIMYNIIIVLKANRSYYGMSIPSQLVVLNFF